MGQCDITAGDRWGRTEHLVRRQDSKCLMQRRLHPKPRESQTKASEVVFNDKIVLSHKYKIKYGSIWIAPKAKAGLSAMCTNGLSQLLRTGKTSCLLQFQVLLKSSSRVTFSACFTFLLVICLALTALSTVLCFLLGSAVQQNLLGPQEGRCACHSAQPWTCSFLLAVYWLLELRGMAAASE